VKKWGKGVRVVEDEVEVKEGEEWRGEKREFGRLALPDRGGFGPLFYCCLEKLDPSPHSDSDSDEATDDSETSESEADADHTDDET
jgi:hypothetical protein